MSIGLSLGLIAAACWGTVDVSAAFAGRRLGSLRVAAVVQLTSIIAIVALCLVRSTGLPAEPGDTLSSVLNGIVAAGAYLSFFTALRIGPVSVVSPVVAAYGGLTVLLAVLLRGETLTPLQAAGAALATGGVVLTGLISEGGLRGTRLVGRGVVLSLIAMACFAILTIGLSGPIRSAGWLPVLLASRLANAATVWVILGAVLGSRASAAEPLLAPALDRRPISRRVAVAAAIVGGLLDIAGFVAFAIGLEQAPTWIVGLASSFGPVVSVVVAVALWGERLQRSQWIGLGGIAAGLIAVALP
ncbi:MAG TPA: EamA family transporter [Candidatus Limnocylindrales bacterium]|nr:EamA family transporter [Candidatus Limnocylindrales bacterium]